MKNKLLIVITAVILFLIPKVNFGQVAPPLGVTSTFALFTAAGAFNNTGASFITGDIGSNSAAVVGIPVPGTMVSGTIYTPLVAPLPQAATDVAAAYAALTQGGPVIGVTLAGQTLTPGKYTTGGASTLNGNLTLNGSGIYIIQVGGALDVGSTSVSDVILTGGATWDNVYWQVGGAFSLGASSVSTFRGTVIASGAINLYTTSTLIGRGLTTAGAINVAANTVTLGSPPAAPTVTRTQPTCTVATGTITVTAPLGAVTYSIGGAYQVGVTFSAVATSATINAQPPTPAAPTVSATLQPTCSVAVGIIVVTAPVGAGMTYSIGGAYQGMTFSGVSPGSYTVTAKNSDGCISPGTNVTINAQPAVPVVIVSNNGPVCEGSLLSLTGGPSGMMTYAWTGPNLFSSISQSPIVSNNATPLMAGIYSLTVIDGNGCISLAATTTVIVNAKPAAPIAGNNGPVCEGSLLSLTGGPAGMTAYAWTGPNLFSSTSQSPTVSTNATAAMAGIYSLTVSDGNGCASLPASTEVRVNALSIATANNNGPVCEGSLLSLSGGPLGMMAYAWTGPNLFTGISQSPIVSNNATSSMAGIYSLTVIDGNGCTSTASTTVIVNATPAEPTVVLYQPTCNYLTTGTIIFMAPTGGGMTYSIGGAYQSGSTFREVAPGTYLATAKSAAGCLSPGKNVTILAKETPALPTAAATLQPTCTVATGTITVTAPTGPGMTYSIGGAYQESAIFSGVAPGIYFVTAKNADGCVSPGMGTIVTINPLQATPAAPTAILTQPTCTVATGTITVTAPIGTGITYSIGGAYQTSVIFSAVASGTYIVTAKNADGCVSPGTSVMINAQPATPAAPTAILIQPTCTLTTGTITVTAPTGTGITYSIGGAYQTSAIFSAVTPGIYIVTAKSAAGCVSAPTAVSIVVLDCGADLSILNTVNNTYPLIGRSVVFTVVATNNGPNGGTGVTVNDILLSGYTYVSSTVTKGNYVSSTGVWTIGTMNNGASETMTVTAKVNPTGSYVSPATITGIELDRNPANNISTTITYPMDFFIPEGFSPDGDGINDLFVIRGINYFPDNEFVIYNRWGNKVFEASSYLNTWDGRSTRGLRVGGDELPTGTYFYMLDLGDGSKVIKGTIYLNR
jgi:gliding motility-associated-like protein/uncharacterized repeat protein (TIGR01451 family)